MKKERTWNNKKIALSAFLVSISTVITVILIKIFPILSISTFKISAISLPLKITGYFFGAFIGILVSFLSDIITFLIFPSFYHPLYTLGIIILGAVPGLVVSIFNKFEIFFMQYKKLKNTNEIWNKGKKFTLLLWNIYWIFTLFILISIIIFVILTISAIPKEIFTNSSTLIKNKQAFILFLISSSLLMAFGISFYRFKTKNLAVFKRTCIIITFSILIEILVTIIYTYADSLIFSNSFLNLLVVNSIFSPVKLWVNLAVVSTAIYIVEPILKRKKW